LPDCCYITTKKTSKKVRKESPTSWRKEKNMGNCGGLPDELSYLWTCGRLICAPVVRPVHLSGRHVKARYASGLSDILCLRPLSVSPEEAFRSTEKKERAEVTDDCTGLKRRALTNIHCMLPRYQDTTVSIWHRRYVLLLLLLYVRTYVYRYFNLYFQSLYLHVLSISTNLLTLSTTLPCQSRHATETILHYPTCATSCVRHILLPPLV
jgi:hypothetical protein